LNSWLEEWLCRLSELSCHESLHLSLQNDTMKSQPMLTILG
jgi:hypothetical protein